jgi:hypothetical protein
VEDDACGVDVGIIFVAARNAVEPRSLPAFLRDVMALRARLRSILGVDADHDASGPCCLLKVRRSGRPFREIVNDALRTGLAINYQVKAW